MYINRSNKGKNNICGEVIAEKRKGMGLSQRQFAEKLQVLGLDVEKNAIQRIESGARFVTDIDLVVIAKALEVSYEELLNG